MAVLARGSVTDRPWGMTFGALGMRGLTGQLTLTADGKQFRVAFDQGVITSAASPIATDSAVRLALTMNLLTSSQVNDIIRRMGAAPGRDEVELLVELARLSPDIAPRLRRRLVAQRAARTFAYDRGDFVVEDQVTIPVVEGCELDVRTIVYLGAKTNVTEERLATELAQMGSFFVLKPSAVGDLPQFGFGQPEQQVLQMVMEGAYLDEMVAAHPSVDDRTIRAVMYALASCGALELGAPPRSPRALTPSSAPTFRNNLDTPTNLRSSGVPVATTSYGGSGPAVSRTNTGSGPNRMPTGGSGPNVTGPAVSRTSTGSAPNKIPMPPRTTTGSGPNASGPVVSRTSTGAEPNVIRPNPVPAVPRTTTGSGARPRPPTPSTVSPTPSRSHTPSVPPAIGRTPTPGVRAKPASTPPPGTEGVVRLKPPTNAPPMPTAAITAPTQPIRKQAVVARRARRDSTAANEIEALLTTKMPLLEQGVDHFTLLGLAMDAPAADVRSAYFTLARKLHPDRLAAIGVDDEGRRAQRLMAQVNLAFAVLNDNAKREEYVSVMRRGGEAAVKAEEAKADELAMRIMRAEEAFKQGEMALRRDQLAQAIEAFQMAVELQPKESEYQALLAWAQFAAAPDKNAVAGATRKALLRAAEANDRSPTAPFYLGRVERMLGKEREALAYFEQVLAIKPNHTEAASEARILKQRLNKK